MGRFGGDRHLRAAALSGYAGGICREAAAVSPMASGKPDGAAGSRGAFCRQVPAAYGCHAALPAGVAGRRIPVCGDLCKSLFGRPCSVFPRPDDCGRVPAGCRTIEGAAAFRCTACRVTGFAAGQADFGTGSGSRMIFGNIHTAGTAAVHLSGFIGSLLRGVSPPALPGGPKADVRRAEDGESAGLLGQWIEKQFYSF